ncbi:MAG: sugar transferase [Patescibacteria group bacterium]|jgi:exopolysaccharide biosynthesis polyprenyl glycosylphosphotransferase
MKKAELLFGFILLPLDYVMLVLAATSAYFLRFGETVTGIKQAVYAMPFKEFIIIALCTSGILIILFAWSGLYNISGTRRIITEIRRIIVACSTGVLIVIILIFFNRELFSSRFIILAAWFLSIFYVVFARYVVIQIERYLFSKKIGLHHVVLIGDGHTAHTLKNTIKNNSALGFEISEECQTINGDILNKLAKIIRIKQIDEILLAQPDLSFSQKAELIDFCGEHNLAFKYAADVFETKSRNVEIRPLAGIPIIEIKKTPLDGWGKIFKRIIDIILSILWLIGTSWAMILVAIAIKLSDKGPVIYKNERVGFNRKVFKTYKFRSMKAEYCVGKDYGDEKKALAYEEKLIKEKSIKKGPVYKIKDDPRITRLGRFIRKTSLDEFPQVFNVLKGEMSWVGPRPHQPREVAQYKKHQKEVLTIKPGITGLAQISGRSDLDFEEEVRLDTYYIENWSMWLDIYILFKTPLTLFRKRQAL